VLSETHCISFKVILMKKKKSMEQALSGIKVLDLSQFLSGPRCTEMLCDFGAEVVKVEPPVGETMRLWMNLVEGQDRAMTVWHRSKKAVTLNLKHEKGVEMLKRLVPHFDVLVENLAPGTLDKAGVGWDELRKIHPGLIYCSISGFGREGPLSHRLAFDLIAQATGGIMHSLQLPHRPPGVFFGDLVSGAYAAFAILAALRWRDATGEGQIIDVPMQDVMYFHDFQSMQMRAIEPVKDKVKDALGGDFLELFGSDEGMPFWNSYKAKDGYIAVVFLTDRQWGIMADLIGRPELKTDPRFSNLFARIANRDEVQEVVREWMETKTVAELDKILDEHRIPCGIVATADMVNQDDSLKAHDMLTSAPDTEYGEIASPGIPVKMSASPGRITSSAPRLGQHNLEIYSKYLKLDAKDLEELKKEGVI
jgi:CoA:oxalate CoA-transferase